MNKYALFVGDRTLLVSAPNLRWIHAEKLKEAAEQGETVIAVEISAKGPQWLGVSQRHDAQEIEDLKAQVSA
jgi:hypothetical protein